MDLSLGRRRRRRTRLLGFSMAQFKMSLRHSEFHWRKREIWHFFAPLTRQ
jgi:hypothetical protein